MLVGATARSLAIANFYKCLHARFLIRGGGGSFLKVLVARRLTFVKARAWKYKRCARMLAECIR